MTMQIIIATLAALSGPIVWWLTHNKIPTSFSQIATGEKWWKYLFAASLLVFGGNIWFSYIDRISENWQWLLFLTMVGLLFVAVTPITNIKSIKVHYAAAILAGVSITLLTAVVCPALLLLWAGYVGYTLMTDGKYKKLIAEATCFINMIFLSLAL